jgi:hypothetical protein
MECKLFNQKPGGNCCEIASHEDEGHQMKPTKTLGQTLGGNSSETEKEAMLAAAKQRRIQVSYHSNTNTNWIYSCIIAKEINRVYTLFQNRNPDFLNKGKVSILGYSLGVSSCNDTFFFTIYSNIKSSLY